jgi:hypothetical protein
VIHPRRHEPTTIHPYLQRLFALHVHSERHIQFSSQPFDIRLQRVIDAVFGAAFPAAKVLVLVAMENDVLAETAGALELVVDFVQDLLWKTGD